MKLFALIVMFVAIISSSHAENINDCIKYLSNRDNRAIECANNEVKKSPKDANLYVFRGTTHSSFGNANAALDDYSSAIRLSPSNQNAYIMRAGIYININKYEQSLYDFERAINLDNGKNKSLSASLYLQYSGVLQMIKRYDKAIKSYNISLQKLKQIPESEFNSAPKIPNSPLSMKEGLFFDAYNGLCTSMIQQNYYTDAMKYCKLASDLDKNSILAMSNLASTYIETGRFNDALETLESVKYKDNFYIQYNYAALYFNMYKVQKNPDYKAKYEQYMVSSEKYANQEQKKIVANLSLKIEAFSK